MKWLSKLNIKFGKRKEERNGYTYVFEASEERRGTQIILQVLQKFTICRDTTGLNPFMREVTMKKYWKEEPRD